jgi:hypothetical protein
MRNWFQPRVWLSTIALFVVAAWPAQAQDIAIKPLLRAGDQFRLEVTRVRENSARPQLDGKSTTPIDVRVETVTDNGITLTWTSGTTSFDNPQLAQNPLLMAAAKAVAGLVLRINLNADGEFAGLANESEVVSRLRATVDAIVSALAAKLPDEQKKPFQAVIGQLLSPSVLIASATREAQIYFGLNGIVVSAGEAVERSVDQPNPLGSGSIPAMLTISTESATSDSAILVTTSSYDPESLRKVTLGFIEQSGKRVPPEALAKLPQIQMDDTGRYVLDRGVGLMREVTVNRRVSAGANHRVDRWEIRLSQPPPR